MEITHSKMKFNQLHIIWILQFQVAALAFNETINIKHACSIYDFKIICKNFDLNNKRLNFEQLNGTYMLYLTRTNLHSLQENVFNGTQIKHLSIYDNPLTVIDKNAFGGQEDFLKSLELSTTNTTELVDFTALQNLYNLETLEIEHFYMNQNLNNFTSNKLTKLTKLSLINNKIQYFSTKAFVHLGNLTQLHITKNNLDKIPLPQTFKYLPNLQHLDMTENAIKEISMGNLQENRKLENLYLIENSISKVDEFAFQNIENSLRHLDLSLNTITEDHLKHFKNLSKLETLNFNYNKIKSLSGDIFQNMNKLKTLSVRNNQLTKLQKTHLNGLSNLKELSLKENQLIIEATTMTEVPLLEILYLDNQNLKGTMEIKWLENTSGTLKTLSLKGNSFNNKDLWTAIKTLSHLEILDLSKCNLAVIPAFAFEQNSKLKVIKLNDNKLETLEEGAFQGLQNTLESIKLSNNQLQVVDECVFNNFTWPEKEYFNIDLNNNKLVCNCSLHWLQVQVQEFIKKSNDIISSVNYLKCLTANGEELIAKTNLTCNSNTTVCQDFGSRYTTQTAQVISTDELSTISNINTQTKQETSMKTIKESSISTTSSTPKLENATKTTEESGLSTTNSITKTTPKRFQKPNITVNLYREGSNVKISWNISDLYWVKYFILQIKEILPNQERKFQSILIHKLTQFHIYPYLNSESILHICIIVNVTANSNLIDACDTLRPKKKEDSPSTSNKNTLEIGLGIGVFVALLILLILCYVLYRRHKNNKKHIYEEPTNSARTQVNLTPKTKRYLRKKPNETKEPTVSVISHGQLQPDQQLSAGSYQYLDNPSFILGENYEEIQNPQTVQDKALDNKENIRNGGKKSTFQDQSLPINNIPAQRGSHLNHAQRPLPCLPQNENGNILNNKNVIIYTTLELRESDI